MGAGEVESGCFAMGTGEGWVSGVGRVGRGWEAKGSGQGKGWGRGGESEGSVCVSICHVDQSGLSEGRAGAAK